MKKIFFIFSVLALFITVAPIEGYAQALSKDEIKQAKKRAKEYVKDGWQNQGSTSIEAKLIEIRKREMAGEVLLTGAALDGYKKSNTALANCQQRAIEEYAKMTGEGIMEGRVTSQVSDMSDEETDNLVDMAEQNFIKALKGELGIPVLKLTKEKSGLHYMQCWWLLNENKIEKIRENAIKRALGDAENASQVGEKISDFINGGKHGK